MSELLRIDCSGHIEKKQGLSYLSWAWAWAEVLKVDPKATWWVHEYAHGNASELPAMFLPDGSAMVKVSVKIKDDTKTCLLPVMDHRNKAIKNPDAFAVNTAIMRCMVKAIAMHGLGLFIYAGEDLPEGTEPKPEPKPVIKATDGAEQTIDADTRAELDELAAYLVECHQAGKDLDAIQCWYGTDLENDHRVYLWQQLGPYSKLRSAIKSNRPKEAA